MTWCRLVRMLAIGPPILPVVSTNRTTSGLGGMTGVWTILFTLNDVLGLALCTTLPGSTPGAAKAGEPTATARAVAPPSIRDQRLALARRWEGRNGMCKICSL